MDCVQMYGRKNLRILYDAISTLCDAIGGALAEVSVSNPGKEHSTYPFLPQHYCHDFGVHL